MTNLVESGGPGALAVLVERTPHGLRGQKTEKNENGVSRWKLRFVSVTVRISEPELLDFGSVGGQEVKKTISQEDKKAEANAKDREEWKRQEEEDPKKFSRLSCIQDLR